MNILQRIKPLWSAGCCGPSHSWLKWKKILQDIISLPSPNFLHCFRLKKDLPCWSVRRKNYCLWEVHPRSPQLHCPLLVYAPDKSRLLSVYGQLSANINWFFAFFLDLLDWIVLILVWIERSFSPAQVRWNVQTDNVTSSGRDLDLHRWLWAVQGQMG